ncbi:hypothetical protein STFR1_10652 [Bacillus vallismortis]
MFYEKISEKLNGNHRKSIKKNTARGFAYQFADVGQSRDLLEVVLSNSIECMLRENSR